VTTAEYVIKWINDARGAVEAMSTAEKLTLKVDGVNRAFQKANVSAGKGKKFFSELGTEMGKMSFSAKDVVKALARVIVVAPVWMIFRNLIKGVTSAIAEAGKSFNEFQKEMGRVATVTKAVGATEEEFKALERQIISFAATSSASMKDTATAVYQLSTAGLDATEAMAGFQHVMNLSIATMTDVNTTGRLVAGAYNLFGKEMEATLTTSEKFQHISDVLATTFKTQQVELNEIATAFGFAGNAANSINFQFEDLVATIGFLNTGMLRGTKAGTSLTNAMIKMSQNADLLEEVTGKAFDPTKPLDFVETMKVLNQRFGEGRLALDDDVKLIQAFGIRGVRAVKSILQRWDEWEDALKRNRGDVTDAAEEMREAFEDNVSAQIEEMSQKYAEFTSALATKTTGVAVPALKDINANMTALVDLMNKPDWEKFAGVLALAFTGNQKTMKDYLALMNKIIEARDTPPSEGSSASPKRTTRTSDQFKKDIAQLKAGGATNLQIAQETAYYYEIELKMAQDTTKVLEARNKVEEEQIKLLVKQASEIRKIVSSSLADSLKEGDITQFSKLLGERIREAVMDNVAEGLTNAFFNQTNLDVGLGQALDGIKIERAIITGADYHASAITKAMSGGAVGNAGSTLSTIGQYSNGSNKSAVTYSMNNGVPSTQKFPIAPADYYKTGGQPSLFQKGKGLLDKFGGIGGIASMATLGLLFSSGGKGKVSSGNTYSTSPGGTTSDASTRSTTVAKITNIQIAPNFILDGASINDENTIKESAERLALLMKDEVLRILEDENIATGNV